MTLPGATRERGIWLSLNRIKPDYRGNRYGLPGYGSSRVGTYDHVAFGVTPLDSQALVEKINARWPFGARRRPARRERRSLGTTSTEPPRCHNGA
jgi:hypothetical protein